MTTYVNQINSSEEVIHIKLYEVGRLDWLPHASVKYVFTVKMGLYQMHMHVRECIHTHHSYLLIISQYWVISHGSFDCKLCYLHPHPCMPILAMFHHVPELKTLNV